MDRVDNREVMPAVAARREPVALAVQLAAQPRGVPRRAGPGDPPAGLVVRPRPLRRNVAPLRLAV